MNDQLFSMISWEHENDLQLHEATLQAAEAKLWDLYYIAKSVCKLFPWIP